MFHSHSYGKSPFLMGKSTISMAIFNSYVSLPEGSSVSLGFLRKTQVLPSIDIFNFFISKTWILDIPKFYHPLTIVFHRSKTRMTICNSYHSLVSPDSFAGRVLHGCSSQRVCFRKALINHVFIYIRVRVCIYIYIYMYSICIRYIPYERIFLT